MPQRKIIDNSRLDYSDVWCLVNLHFRRFLVLLKPEMQVYNILVDREIILMGLAKLGNYRLSQLFDFGRMPNVLLALLLLFKRSQWSFGRSNEKCFINRVLVFPRREIKIILYPQKCFVYKYISCYSKLYIQS